MMAPAPPPMTTDEWRGLMRVLRQCLGVVVQYWDSIGLAPGHPYRHAVRMLDSYVQRHYHV